ncbi:MAG: ATP phosphoribosyltransferase regulatory subunit [Leptospiraceae bacterium]|nr:ATP phosphoribosyltransferase regulatory subunit [Leptospiraceae bacterium]
MMANNERFRSWLPHGFDFLTPADTERLNRMVSALRQTFHSADYQEITPPTLDYARTFSLTTRDSLHSDTAFEMRGSSGDHLAVRTDLTVQVVKAVANGRLSQDFPVRFCYLQPVFQDRPWGQGHRREMFQAGVEWIGTDAADRFRVLLALARDCLAHFEREASILYSDARFLKLLLEAAPPRQRAELSRLVYNKDSAAIRRLNRQLDLAPDLARILEEMPLTFGGPEALDRLEEICQGRPELMAVLREAREIPDVVYDFSLVRELSYYTGPVFAAYIPGSNEKVATGGVYDELYAEFASDNKNACGFALNMTALLEQQLSIGKSVGV